MKKLLLTTFAGFGLTLSFALLANYCKLKTNITIPLEYNVSQKEQINVGENHFHENKCHLEEGNGTYLTYVKSYEKDTPFTFASCEFKISLPLATLRINFRIFLVS
jgi:hypothetical protein